MSIIWLGSSMLVNIFFKYIFTLVIFALTLLVISCWKYKKYRRRYDEFPNYAMDSELVRPLLIDRIEIEHFPHFMFEKIVSGCRKFQKEGLCVVWGVRPLLMVFSDEYVKIFSNEEAALNKSGWIYNIITDAFGYGLITSNGSDWQKSRKLAISILHTQLMKRSMAIFNENAELLVQKLSAVANETFEEMIGMLKKCTLDIFCESVLDIKLSSSENDPKIESYIDWLSKLLKYSIKRIVFPWLQYKQLLPFFASGRQHMKYYEAVRQFNRIVFKEMHKSVLSRTATDLQLGEATHSRQSRKNLSQLLFERLQKDPTFTVEDMQEEINTFMIAGHDTVSYSVLWCLFMLGHHQDIQDKVYEEIRSLPETNLAYEDLSRLTYMMCVIKESMRLYPTVPLYARQLSKDVQCGKYKAPKGTTVVILSYLLHRNPYCHPDPEKFDPDRFSAGSEMRPWTYVPFSEGIRNCIGKRFAMVEMKVILTHIIKNFKVTSLTRTEDVELCWDIMLAPAKPLLFQLKPRQVSGDCS